MVSILYLRALVYAEMIVTVHMPDVGLITVLGYIWLRMLFCLWGSVGTFSVILSLLCWTVLSVILIYWCPHINSGNVTKTLNALNSMDGSNALTLTIIKCNIRYTFFVVPVPTNASDLLLRAKRSTYMTAMITMLKRWWRWRITIGVTRRLVWAIFGMRTIKRTMK